jgi:hypothetical protein
VQHVVSNLPYRGMQSTSAPTGRRRKGGSPHHGRTVQAPHLGCSIKRDIILPIELAATVLFWRTEFILAKAALEAAQESCRFAKEQYEKCIAKIATARQFEEIEPRAKRTKAITTKKGKASAPTRWKKKRSRLGEVSGGSEEGGTR